MSLTDSACNNTAIKIVNANVTYLDGTTEQNIVIVSAGPVGTQGGALSDNNGNAAPITVDYGVTEKFTGSSSDGSNGNFEFDIEIQCNAATSSDSDAIYETLSVTIFGNCSIINSKNCNVGGYNVQSKNFSANVTNSSPSGEGDNWITITVSNGGTG